jgi:hypothetical protein
MFYGKLSGTCFFPSKEFVNLELSSCISVCIELVLTESKFAQQCLLKTANNKYHLLSVVRIETSERETQAPDLLQDPRFGILLEKLTVAQLFKKIKFLWNSKCSLP